MSSVSVAPSRYIDYPIVVDARDLMQLAFAYIQSKNPDWSPSEGQLDTWIIEANASEAADIGTLTSLVDKTIFRFLGEKIYGIAPTDATSATVNAVFHLDDVLGHTIPAGTQVGIADASGNIVPFYVVSDVIVPGGQNTGAVLLAAITPGAAGTGLGAAGTVAQLLDTIVWVDSVTLNETTTGGVDQESDSDYLSDLSQELQTISPTPILPIDFAILARKVAGVQRATAIDGYNPADGTFNNERMITIVALTSAGTGVDAPTKTAISDYLESLREINFVVNTDDPTVVQIDVSANVTTMVGYSTADVIARVTTTIQNFLDPSLWGISSTDDPNNPRIWNNSSTVYYLELAAAIDRTAGVDRITALTIGPHGGAQASQDFVMNGTVPVPDLVTLDVLAV